MRVRISIAALVILGVLTACKKDKFEIKQDNDPVFTLTGDFVSIGCLPVRQEAHFARTQPLKAKRK